MKRLFSVVTLATLALASCDKDTFHQEEIAPGYGTLSFSDAELVVSEETDNGTRAAVDNYCIWVLDSEGQEIDINKAAADKTYVTYSDVATSGITLPAGDYTLVAQSAAAIPAAEFEEPVYGAEQAFTITAGQETTIEEAIVCKLWKQVKVSVDYNDYFLEHLVGEGKATVTVNSTNSLEYAITGNGTHNPTLQQDSNGFFEVPKDNGDDADKSDEVTLEVEFVGSMKVKDEDGTYSTKTQKMRTALEGIKACQWRKIEFVMNEDEDGNASFSIVIDDLVVDATLGEDVNTSEEGIDDDPNAPQGDGNIKLLNTAGLDDSTTPTVSEWNGAFTDDEMDTERYPTIHITQDMAALTFEASVPNQVAAFTVEIISDALEGAVIGLCGTTTLDLVDDTTAVEKVAEIIPFPYGDTVKDKTEIEFDLTKALGALRQAAKGTESTFRMKVLDKLGYSKTIDLKLYVQE